MRTSRPFPRAELGVSLHTRLLANDARAPQEISVAFFPALCDWLDLAYPRVDPHLRQTAAEDALLAYLQAPGRFDPAKAPDLGAYLRMSARGDLLNSLERERRSWCRHPRRVTWGDVEDRVGRGNTLTDGEAAPGTLVRREEADSHLAFFRDVRASLSPEDQAVFDLMRDGVRETAPYARALRLESLPSREQQRGVKQAKDRVMKRLQRGGGRYGRPA